MVVLFYHKRHRSRVSTSLVVLAVHVVVPVVVLVVVPILLL